MSTSARSGGWRPALGAYRRRNSRSRAPRTRCERSFTRGRIEVSVIEPGDQHGDLAPGRRSRGHDPGSRRRRASLYAWYGDRKIADGRAGLEPEKVVERIAHALTARRPARATSSAPRRGSRSRSPAAARPRVRRADRACSAPDAASGRRRHPPRRLASSRSGRSAPDDKDAIAAGFERLSPESRYRRFFAPLQRLTARDLEYLTEVDHHDHEAVIGFDAATGDPVGVARLHPQ